MAYRAHDAKQMAERVHAITAKHEIKRVEFVDNIISKKYFTDFNIPSIIKNAFNIPNLQKYRSRSKYVDKNTKT